MVVAYFLLAFTVAITACCADHVNAQAPKVCEGQHDATIPLGDCTDSFLRCLHGQRHVEVCTPAGTVFNPATGLCDWSSNVEGCAESADNSESRLQVHYPYLQALTGKMVSMVGSTPGRNYVLVSEEDSQVNIEIASAFVGDHGKVSYVKAIGFQHVSGWTLTIDGGIVHSCEDATLKTPSLKVTVAGRVLNTDTFQPATSVLGSTQVLGEAPEGIAFSYNVHQSNTDKQYERIEVATPRVMFSIYRQPHSCLPHLDIDFQLLDAQLASPGNVELHGLLGQTSKWLWQPPEQHALEGNITAYSETSLLSHNSKLSTFSPLDARAGKSKRTVDLLDHPVAIGGLYVAELPEKW